MRHDCLVQNPRRGGLEEEWRRIGGGLEEDWRRIGGALDQDWRRGFRFSIDFRRFVDFR